MRPRWIAEGHRARPRASYLVRGLCSLALLGLLFYLIPIDQVVSTLANLSWPIFLFAILSQFLARAAGALKVKLIAADQGFELSCAAALRIMLTAHYYSLMLPGPVAGGAVTWLRLLGQGASRGAAAATIVVNRGIGIAVMLALGSGAWLLDAGYLDSVELGLALILLGSTLVWALQNRTTPAAVGSEASGRLSRFFDRLMVFRRMAPASKLIVIVSSVAQEAIAAVVIWLFGLAVGLELELLAIFWIRALLQLVLLLPIAIAGLGLREASLIGLGALIGVDPANALTWSLAIFAGTVVVGAVGGLLEAGVIARMLGLDVRQRPR